jgi:hypothetical protein
MKLSNLDFNYVVCGTTATKRYSGCRGRYVTYCSVICQTKHWKSGHKKACVAPDATKKVYSKMFKKIGKKKLSEAVLPQIDLVNEYAPQLRTCSQCRHVKYCTKQWQKAHWLTHETDVLITAVVLTHELVSFSCLQFRDLLTCLLTYLLT